MNVKELKEALNAYPDDMEVRFDTPRKMYQIECVESRAIALKVLVLLSGY